MKESQFPIAPEGFPFIIAALVVTALAWYLLNIYAAVLPGVFLIFCIWFFRDPARIAPPLRDGEKGERVMVPADGRVIAIQDATENRFLKTTTKRVSIFMSPINVHVNRAPVEGVVKGIAYNKGKFFNAAAEKASLDNEQNAIHIDSKSGYPVVFVQIAGFIARRIVSYPKVGDALASGQRFGLIRFGSRMDIYLPLNAEINVGLQQNVTAGETILAHLPQK